jgi:nitrogen fixation NifU-like protein/NifU-like protein
MDQKTSNNCGDVAGRDENQAWFYSETVKDHFFHPRNLLKDEKEAANFDAAGSVGSPACGDQMRVWIKVDQKTKKITDLKWRTFGCASAIASTSAMAEMVLEKEGMTLKQAREITPQDIIARLGGLPARKIHCSVLGDQALRAAIDNYEKSVKE